MVGAITTLIVIVAVFLAYNASNGLPFVPVYRVSIELENAQRPASTTRCGSAATASASSNRSRPSAMRTASPASRRRSPRSTSKLDKTVEPLPADTQVRVRYKSAFGLKYVELTRGTGEGLDEGGVIPVEQSSVQTEFDDIANFFNEPTREAPRENLVGYGNAFAGRGSSLNETIYSSTRCSRTCSRSRRFSRTRRRASRTSSRRSPARASIVAPVAEENAELFEFMATTFGALAADPQALQDTITSGPPTLRRGPSRSPPSTRSCAASPSCRPTCGRACRPSAPLCPTLNDALVVGTPVLERTPPVNAQLARTFLSLQRLVDVPQTKTTLLRLRETFNQTDAADQLGRPVPDGLQLLELLVHLPPEHLTERDTIGYTQRVSVIATPRGPTGPSRARRKLR